MKFLRRSAALALFVLLLAGCSAQSPTPTQSPAPTPPAAESPALPKTPQEEVLHYVDWVLEGENVSLMCWLSNGSGPNSVNLAPYKEEVRTLFAELNWRYASEQDTFTHADTPADWGYYLQAGDASINFFGGTRLDGIDIAYVGLEGNEPLRFTAEGASGLGLAMADLYPGPWIRNQLVEVPAEGLSSDQEMAEAYAAAFERLYLASGHITGFELADLEVLKPMEPDSIYHNFRIAYLVEAVNPDDPYWTSCPAEPDGRYRFDYEVHMLLDEDNIWRCDWLQ